MDHCGTRRKITGSGRRPKAARGELTRDRCTHAVPGRGGRGDNDEDGWRAWIDGVSAQLYEAYGTARAVVVPAGHRRIMMRYLPASVVAGVVLSALGAVAMPGLFFR
jgi:hypothetical protein